MQKVLQLLRSLGDYCVLVAPFALVAVAFVLIWEANPIWVPALVIGGLGAGALLWIAIEAEDHDEMGS